MRAGESRGREALPGEWGSWKRAQPAVAIRVYIYKEYKLIGQRRELPECPVVGSDEETPPGGYDRLTVWTSYQRQ